MHRTPLASDNKLLQPAHAESTRMFREAAEAAAVVETQLARNAGDVARLAADLASRRKSAIVTLARGSSDHAATYARYLIETKLGILTSSAAPSVTSLYASRSYLRDTIVLAISQSGKSPDLLASVEAARTAGACVVALVNAEDSPLARLANFTIPLCAGEELSVAASKSFIASLAAIAQLVAAWTGDRNLHAALDSLPSQLRRAWSLDWSAAVSRLRNAGNLYVLGRGLGLGIAGEAALKLKETCGLHAEAFSTAELRHGPLAIVGTGFPVLVFAQDDESQDGIATLVRELGAHGADVMTIGVCDTAGVSLPTIAADPAMAPLLQIQAFYRMVNALSVARGYDPDRPRHLSKITETL
jgi:glucosamine--fructose-6-phosphate aminotransferase (isomerizing)